jgi:hypothetical protein
MRARGTLLSLALAVIACGSEPEPTGGALTGTSGGGAPVAGTGVAPGSAGTGIAPGVAGSSTGTAGAGMAGRGVGAAGMTSSPAGTGAAAGAGAGGGLAAGSGGAMGRAGRGGSAGAAAGSGGRGAAGAMAGSPAAGSGSVTTEKFSFFVTSLGGMRELSKSNQGFGGNFKFGEATGLAGADKICTTLAEKSLPGSGAKGWRAFLSTAKGGANDGPIHAKDRIGQGPWFDRNGRVVANSLSALLQNRPMGADPAIRDDLPNEEGVPNHTDTMQGMDDNHDTVTGSNAQGMYDNSNTCSDWTSTETASGQKGPSVGHSWPSQQSGVSWIKAHPAPGCAASVALVQMGGGMGTGIGNSGGYGGIYCFALQP